MFLNLPNRIFFEMEMKRKMLQQNDHDWGWYFWLSTDDNGLHINWTWNKMDITNYIILEPSDRTNRLVNFDIKITSDSNGNDIKYQYKQQVQLLFEENFEWVYTYYPDPNHFNWNSNDFKLNVIKLTSENPSWDVDRNEWRGFQCIGFRVWNKPVIVEIPIDNFAPENENWSYAVLRGHWLSSSTNLLYKDENGIIKPISWCHTNREFEFVLKPNESILYSSYFDGSGRGFGITYIHFFR